MNSPVIRCVLSGSYRHDYDGLLSAYRELVACGCQVLSPHRLDFGSKDTLFVKDAAEQVLSDEAVEKHHLLAISQADFVWLHLPNGYVGLSGAFETGYALGVGVQVFSSMAPAEPIFSSFIRVVPSVYKAIESLPAVEEAKPFQ